MTGKQTSTHIKKAITYKAFSKRGLVYVYMSLFVALLFFKNSDASAAWVTDGISLCLGKLIPSLFPFMVISSLIVSSGLGRTISRAFRAPVRLLLGLSEECACALLLGWLCGFPLGAKCASELYLKGRISVEEYQRVLCVCGTPSPAFLFSTVGSSMLGDKKYGIWLYAISLLSAVCVGIFLKLTSPLNTAKKVSAVHAEERFSFAGALTRAVSDAAVGMLSVCAFVVFFSAFLGALEASLGFLPLSETAHSLLFCFFELTSGLDKICSLSSPAVFPLCALAVGWSGLSVHFQTMSICASDAHTPSFKGYFISHLARALISLAIALVVSWVCGI